MQLLKIKLVKLGSLKYPVNFRSIVKWRSRVFTVEYIDTIQEIGNADTGWEYSDQSLTKLIQPDSAFDLTVGLINAPLESNYYSRRLDNNVCVISLFEIDGILRASNIRTENFILRSLYQLCCYYVEAGYKLFPTSKYSVAHDEMRHCLFDMNANKADVVYSTERPRLCKSCKARIEQPHVPEDFLPSVETELKKIKKELYFRIADFIKEYPVFSLIITVITGIVLNMVASYLYDVLIKPMLSARN